MSSRTIRKALQERAFRKDCKEVANYKRSIRLGVATIQPSAVIQAATLERAVGDWFLAQLPKRASNPQEAEALAPLLQTLQHVHDDHEYHRLQAMSRDELEAIDGA